MTKRKRRQLFNPFIFRSFSQQQAEATNENQQVDNTQSIENDQLVNTTPQKFPTRQFHNPFGQFFTPYPGIRPDTVPKTKAITPVDPLFGFESEENILPVTETININAIHSYTKQIISTLHTIDKSLELVVKGLTILDNYNINLSSITGNAPKAGGPNVLKLATDFIKKINVNQLEQTINLLQSPMVVELLANGLSFDDDESNDTSEDNN